MNTVLIIQARMGSTRLPGKSMLDLAGKPLIGWVIHRLKSTSLVDKIILSTTQKHEDDILEKIGLQYEIDIFRGSENDLVDRYYQALKGKKIKHILRLPADNPIPDPAEYNRLIKYHLKKNNDFSSNICNFMGNGYPDGIGVEIFTMKSLYSIWKNEKR